MRPEGAAGRGLCWGRRIEAADPLDKPAKAGAQGIRASRPRHLCTAEVAAVKTAENALAQQVVTNGLQPGKPA